MTRNTPAEPGAAKPRMVDESYDPNDPIEVQNATSTATQEGNTDDSGSAQEDESE